jgi:hypothetical protein
MPRARARAPEQILQAPVRPAPRPGHDARVASPHLLCPVLTSAGGASIKYHRLLIWPGSGQAATVKRPRPQQRRVPRRRAACCVMIETLVEG